MLELAAFLTALVAQFVNTLAGMGYGAISCSLLMFFLPPHFASAVVHQAGTVAFLASGTSHLKFGNVERGMLVKLSVAGCVGGALGAAVLSMLCAHATYIAYVSVCMRAYLAAVGALILTKRPLFRRVSLTALGLVAGFLDAWGTGWGSIVTSTLTASGRDARKVVGTANASRLFVALAQSVTFASFVGIHSLLLPFVAGAVVASPIAAKLCASVDAKKLALLIGALLVVLNSYSIATASL